jgi:zinc protease
LPAIRKYKHKSSVSLFLLKFAHYNQPGTELLMINIQKCILDNGLRLIVHSDKSTPLTAFNLLYNVGSKHEDPAMTGFAHLFEHLMFSGTKRVPDFDSAVEIAGGESNAFTNSDITNFYITIPTENLETALWLESDRMRGLDLSAKNLRVQKDVVSEEFRQRYLNQPYGDSMLFLKPLVYRAHPYRWPTIGMDLSHIEKASAPEAKKFFGRFYSPDNAIVTIAGNITMKKACMLLEKWFGSIPMANYIRPELPSEPEQKEQRKLILERPVPANVIFKAWVMPKRTNPDFHVYDMITDILSGGESGRLFKSLVREKRIFNEINSYVTGETDGGMLIIMGALAEGITFQVAEESVMEEIDSLRSTLVSEKEYQKVINRFESEFHLSHTGALAKATALSFHELLGDANSINNEILNFKSVKREDILNTTSLRLTEERSSTLYYKSITD